MHRYALVTMAVQANETQKTAPSFLRGEALVLSTRERGIRERAEHLYGGGQSKDRRPTPAVAEHPASEEVAEDAR